MLKQSKINSELVSKTKQVILFQFLKEFFKTAEGIATSLKKVKMIGFDAIQVSELRPIGTAELRKIIDGEGFACSGTHESG